MQYLCDTNVISEVMRREPNPGVRLWLAKQEMILVSVITVEEIHCGLAHKDARQQGAWFEKFLTTRCQALSITDTIARLSGELRGQLLRRGSVRTQADRLIAATAAHHRLILATRNVSDFRDCGVQVLNPFEEH